MLLNLDLGDWKSFGPSPPGDQARALRLARLTLLVGPNGSGKSNVFDALRFLQGAAVDYPLADVLRGRHEGQREVWPGVRGGIAEAARVGTDSFEISSFWQLEQEFLGHVVRVDTLGEPKVVTEALVDGEPRLRSALYDTHASSLGASGGSVPGGGIRAAFRTSGGGRSASAVYTAHRLLLGQMQPADRMHVNVVPRAMALRSAMREITFLDIRPSLMRDYRPLHAGALGVSGENISPVLRELDETARTDILDWLNELCAPEIVDVEFDETRLREVMFILVEKSGRRVSARSTSDGTLRFLGLVVALLTAPEGSLLVLEEPDVGLHPSRIRLLAELLESVVERRHLQVLATTHSPTLLAHLSRSALGDVLAFGRDSTGNTISKRLRDLPTFETLTRSDHMDSLISTGWIERAL